MATKRMTIPAGKFKAQCLALLDRVARTHEEVVVTKRGRPVARVVALASSKARGLAGSIRSDDDLVAPLDVKWNATR
jgi:prevent-host-death family protein